MRTVWKKHKRAISVVAGFVLLVGLLQLWWITASARGRLAARYDVWRGHYAIQSYGLNLWCREYSSLLKQRYGVKTHVLALCIVSKDIVDYADAYNKISVAAANQKFGRDIFNECALQAKDEWQRKVAQARKQE